MDAAYADLGHLSEGTRLSVDITAPACVRLMMPECMVLRQFGFPFVYHGGLYSAGTVTLVVPEDGHWVHMVDLDGLRHPVSVSPVRIERPTRRRRFLSPA
jgi:hypothetical protein